MAKKIQKLTVTKSNVLVTAAYRLTLTEQRLILAAICKLDPRKPMPKTVSVSASDYSDIYCVPLTRCYEQMKEAADNLYERDIKTFDQRGVERKRWVDKARYVAGEGKVEISFTIHVMPYLSMLYSKVTSYDLHRVARLETIHSFRLFEMLMQFRSTGWAYLEVDTLRMALGLSDSYQRFNNLRQRVIEPAVAELRLKSNLEVDYEVIKEGRNVVALRFTFKDLAQMVLNLPLDEVKEVPVLEVSEESEWLLARPLQEFAGIEDGQMPFIDQGNLDLPEE